MRSKRADIEFYREMMERFQEEGASKSALLSSLLEENKALREQVAVMRLSHKEDMESLRESHREDLDKLRAFFENKLEHMAEINAGLSDRSSKIRSPRGGWQGRRDTGAPPSSGTFSTTAWRCRARAGRTTSTALRRRPRRGSESRGGRANRGPGTSARKRGPHTPEGKMRFDAVIEHPMEEFMELPEGARLIPWAKAFAKSET